MRKGLQEDVRLRRNLEINTCKVVVRTLQERVLVMSNCRPKAGRLSQQLGVYMSSIFGKCLIGRQMWCQHLSLLPHLPPELLFLSLSHQL